MNDFIKMSRYAGMREDLVQAGGGNSAYKINKYRMAVKASGYQLADVSKTYGYAVVNLEMIQRAFLEDTNVNHMTEEEARRILGQAFIKGSRPSIETFLHAVSGKYSLHTHPIVVNILTSRSGGLDILKAMFPDALTVPYATPGVELAKTYFRSYRQHGEDVQIVFLQNHGLLVSAGTAEEVIDLTEMIIRKIEGYLEMDMSASHAVTELYNAIDKGIIWHVTDGNIKDARSILGRVWDHAFCPDCVVFLGKRMYDAGNEIDILRLKEFQAEYGEPVVIAYRDDLYIHADSVKKAMEIQSVLSFSAQVMLENAGKECCMLSDQERDFLLGWDAEKYRRNMR